jgi:hypothetical protein
MSPKFARAEVLGEGQETGRPDDDLTDLEDLYPEEGEE